MPIRAIEHLTPRDVEVGLRLIDHVNGGTHCVNRIKRPMIGAENEGSAAIKIRAIVGTITRLEVVGAKIGLEARIYCTFDRSRPLHLAEMPTARRS